MLEMTCFGNAITMRHNNTLAFQPVGACIASPLCRRCFPVRVSIGVKRLERQLRTRNARPYSVKENIDYINVVSIALITSDISILSRETPTLPKYPTLSTWAKINDVSFALITSDISILSRETPTLPKYPT